MKQKLYEEGYCHIKPRRRCYFIPFCVNSNNGFDFKLQTTKTKAFQRLSLIKAPSTERAAQRASSVRQAVGRDVSAAYRG